LVEDAAKGTERLRAKLVDVGERLRALGRRFGFKLHVGISSPAASRSLPEAYRAALSAAERALSEGAPVAFEEPNQKQIGSPLGEQRRALARAAAENPSEASRLFERYLEAVAVHSGYRLEPTKAHAEAGFDQLLDALRVAELLGERSLGDLRETLQRASQAETVHDLVGAYRRAIAELEQALFRPNSAHQERSVRRALAFVAEHLGESLTLSRVARVAGFAPAYFSRIFATQEKTTFKRHVEGLRVARAKYLLESSSMGVERIGELTGFRTRSRFHVAFKRSTGVTPAEFRRGFERLTSRDKKQSTKR
jgi:YesN/AraC family two-component response regulator